MSSPATQTPRYTTCKPCGGEWGAPGLTAAHGGCGGAAWLTLEDRLRGLCLCEDAWRVELVHCILGGLPSEEALPLFGSLAMQVLQAHLGHPILLPRRWQHRSAGKKREMVGWGGQMPAGLHCTPTIHTA